MGRDAERIESAARRIIMSKETRKDVATIAARILASNKYSAEVKRVAASALAQFEKEKSLQDFNKQKPPEDVAIILYASQFGLFTLSIVRYKGYRSFEELDAFLTPTGRIFNCNGDYKILWQSVKEYKEQNVYPLLEAMQKESDETEITAEEVLAKAEEMEGR